MNTLLLSAAEPSGDALAGPLLDALLRERPHLAVAGVTGPDMRAAGGAALSSLADVGALSAGGLVELLPQATTLLRTRRLLHRAVDGRPDGVVLVDAPDLHLPLLARAKGRGLPTVQVVAPQFWAWRPGRARKLARIADRVLCLFRFEVKRLEAAGTSATWVGHPLATLEPPSVPERRRPRVLLLPGSRRGERARSTAPMLAAASALGDVDVVLSWMGAEPPPTGVTLAQGDGREELADCDAALVAAGTATLEASLLGVPQVVVASAHPVTAALARPLIQTPWFALPNVLLGRAAVPEVVQDLDVPALTRALSAALSRREEARALAEEVRAALGGPGFADRAAAAVLEVIP